MGGFWFKVIWWLYVFGVRCLWRHNLTSFPCFQTNVLAKFVDIVCIFFYIHFPYFMCRCTEYELSALQVRLSEKNKLNATTQQFITAKITGWALKQGNETHSSLRQSNLQLQNQAALVEVQQTFSFPFSLLRHYQMPECFCVDNCGFWASATVLSRYRNC